MVSARVIMGGVVVLFVFMISSIFGVLISGSIIQGFIDSGEMDADQMIAANKFLNVLTLFDKIAVALMIILIIGVAVTTYKLASSPVFFVVMFVVGALFGFAAYILDYIFQEIMSDAAFSTVILLFPSSIVIGTNLHWVALAMIVVGSITLWGKKPQGQEVLR